MLLGAALTAVTVLSLASSSERPDEVNAQECVALVAGCNPVAVTFPDDTPYQTIADAVSPPEILVSIWEFDAGAVVWRGCAPNVPPEVCNLTEMDFLDVAFLCVNAPGVFCRPEI